MALIPQNMIDKFIPILSGRIVVIHTRADILMGDWKSIESKNWSLDISGYLVLFIQSIENMNESFLENLIWHSIGRSLDNAPFQFSAMKRNVV